MVPGLRNAEFVRYGVMHRNTFLDSPRLLDADFCPRPPEPLFCRADDRCGGLHGIRRIRSARRHERGAQA